MAGMKPFPWALLVGVVTFIVAYVVHMGIGVFLYSHNSGTLPDLLYAIPIPFFIAACVGAIAFQLRSSR
jgi:hypothetical protein